MIIESVRVRNFRSIKDATLNCDRLTALVGANGSGKSSFLKAIGIFDDDKARVTENDYHKNDTGGEISVSVTFADLPSEAAGEFAGYVTDGRLTVERIFAWDGEAGKADSAFRSRMLTNPDFVGVRTAAGAENVKAAYNELRKGKYQEFPPITTQKGIIAHLDKEDRENPERRTEAVYDDKFGDKWARRGRFVRFVTIPAVRDASEDVNDAKNSPLALLTAEVKQRIEGEGEYQEFCERVRADRAKVMQGAGGGLDAIGDSITKNIQQFVDGARVRLAWSEESPDIELPRIEVTFDEDGHESTVGRAGHGSQRAFVMAMLQEMEQARREEPAEQARAGSPSLILSIEEPELYQHPVRQRHISTVLDSLAESDGRQTQIIYTTHSPHFAGIDKLNRVRLLQKAAAATGQAGDTRVNETGIRQLVGRLETAGIRKDERSMVERLKVIMTPWLNEGFFAKTVVLVEGASDYAAIMGMSLLLEYRFEASGISVIPCDGIGNMPEPFVIFTDLKIPTYAVWDLDNKADESEQGPTSASRAMQDLLGALPNETQIKGDFACFETDLEGAIKADMGEDLFDELVERQRLRFGMRGRDDKKVLGKSQVMYEVLKQAEERRRPCSTIKEVVEKIAAKASLSRKDPQDHTRQG